MTLKLRNKNWIIIAITSIIFFELLTVGWLVYKRYNTKPASQKTNSSQPAANNTAILEHGLGVQLDNKLAVGLVYAKEESGYAFSSQSLMDKTDGKDGQCSIANAPLGRITRISKASLQDPGSFYTESDMQAIAKYGSAKELGDYYLLYDSPQETCSPTGNTAGEQQQVADTQRVKELFVSMHK